MVDCDFSHIRHLTNNDSVVHRLITADWDSAPAFPRVWDASLRKENACSKSISLLNEGPISRMVLPAEWCKGSEQAGGVGQRTLESFNPPGEPAVQLSFFYRGLPLHPDETQTFTQLLKQHSSEKSVQVLSARQIADLSQVLGETTVGDNQYSYARMHNQKVENDPAKLALSHSRTAPVFHLIAAHTQRLNGESVLVVEGNFVDSGGRKVNDYQGVYIDAGGGKIQEISLQAERLQSSGAEKYFKHLPAFRKSLETIEWSPNGGSK